MKKLFFKHEIGARYDLKVQNLIAEYGIAGFGLYWYIVEMMYDNEGYLPREQYKSIAFALHTDANLVSNVLQSELFCYSEEKDSYYSERIIKELSHMQDVSEQRRNSVNSRWKKYNSITNVVQNCTDKDKDKDKDKDIRDNTDNSKDQSLPILSMDFDLPAEDPVPKKKSSRFIKPTYQEVKNYCNERENNINPEAFIDFYESKGWKVGNQPMKDWKAAVRTWEKKENRYGNSNNHRTTFEERNYVSHEFNESDGTI